MKSTFLLTVTTAIALIAGPASAAALLTGYTIGGSSQLLTTNGGGGDTLFVDIANTGGEQDLNFPTGVGAAATVLLPGTGQWNIGDTVSITGVALPIRGNTAAGTFTFDIRQAAGGGGASGGAGLASLGTATASYADAATLTHYVNFDTPVTFVVDANSTSIGINIANTGTLGLKAWNNDGGEGRLRRYNTSNGNLVNSYMRFSVAGIVVPGIPEPASISVAAFGLAMVAGRRRR